MITVPVSAGAYQAVVANLQQSGGLTFQTSEGLSSNANNTIQLISTPLQLANGQIIAKVDTNEDSSRSSIQNLVTKVMGQQSIHNEVKPATLTITPVGTSGTGSGTATTSAGSVIQMVQSTNGTSTRLLRSTRAQAAGVEQADQPDTTESLD